VKLIVSVLLLASICFALETADAKARITEELQQSIAESHATDLVPVIISMDKQADFRALQTMTLGSTREEKRETVVLELKRMAATSQQQVLDYLETKHRDGEAEVVRSLWIVNAVAAKATRDVIETIAQMDGVDWIELDEVVNLLLEGSSEVTVRQVPAGPVTTAIPVEPSIELLGAPEIWEQGYTGKCVIVGVLDTGVNYNHVDLADHMWVDPEGDYPHHGYDFSNGDDDPMDDHGHGTHCAGTVAGDGTAGRAVGMAPDALIMGIKVLDENGSANPSFTNVWAGVEFAVEQGAHVLSLSLGRVDASATIRIGSRITFTNALAAGVVSAVAAGNERDDGAPPVPRNIRNPGDCPPPWLHPDQVALQSGGVCGVITVGATTVGDDIGFLSSFGPSEWNIILFYIDYPHPPGLLDPDVCAPGINITSLDAFDPTGYAAGWNGTSMATPHVAGAIALMLQKNDDLFPAEIDSILETTSVDLGPAGKDNDFGAGRVDALEAMNALPGAGVMELEWSTVDMSFSPPDPWVQEGLLIDSLCVAAGADIHNVRLIADPLQCADVPCEPDHVKEIHHHEIEFLPQEIPFIRAGDAACSELKVSVPVGQHAGTYVGLVHVIAEIDDPCLLPKISRDLTLTVDVLPTVDMDVDDNHASVSDNVLHLKGAKATQVSGSFTIVNPNSEAKNVDLADGPGNIRIEPVSVVSTDLVKIGDPAEMIPAGAVTFDPLVSLASGEAVDIQVDVDIPDGLPVNAVYTGTVTVTYDECVHARRANRHMLGGGPVSDEFTLEIELLPTQGPLEIVDAVLDEDFCPPDPWTQVGQIEYNFTISATGDHRNIRVSSGGLEHSTLDKKLDQFNFFPGEIAFLAAGETREVRVVTKVPIGQHAGAYSGIFRIVSENGGEDSILATSEVCVNPDLDIEDDLGNLSGNIMHLEAPREGVAYGVFKFVNPNLPDNNTDLVDGPGNVDLVDLEAVPTDLWFAGGGPPPKEPIPTSMIDIDLYPDASLLPSGAGGFGVIQVSIPKWAHHWVPGYNFEYWGDLELWGYYSGDGFSDGFKITLRVLKNLGGGTSCGFWGEREGDSNVLHWADLGLSETGYSIYRGGEKIVELPEEEHLYADPVISRAVYEYTLGVNVGGSEIMVGPISIGGLGLPTTFHLGQNHPNPFSLATNMRYEIPSACKVDLKIYNSAGRIVKTLVNEPQTTGHYSVTWDGKDDSNRKVAAGVYLCRLQAGGFYGTRKMILVR
jgi:serine protease AprX